MKEVRDGYAGDYGEIPVISKGTQGQEAATLTDPTERQQLIISFSGFESVEEQTGARRVFFVLLAPSAPCNVFKAAKTYS